MIYYGTEAGMDGADDPDDRMPMVWDDLEYAPRTVGPNGPLPGSQQPVSFDRDLFDYYRELMKVRKENEALRRGEFKVVATDDATQTIVFERRTQDQTMLVAVNRSNEQSEIKLPSNLWENSVELQPVISSSGEVAEATQSENDIVLSIPPQSGQIWQAEMKR